MLVEEMNLALMQLLFLTFHIQIFDSICYFSEAACEQLLPMPVLGCLTDVQEICSSLCGVCLIGHDVDMT